MEQGMTAWVTECLMEGSDWWCDKVDSKTDAVYQGEEELYYLRIDGDEVEVLEIGLEGVPSDIDAAFNRNGRVVRWKDALREHAMHLMELCK